MISPLKTDYLLKNTSWSILKICVHPQKSTLEMYPKISTRKLALKMFSVSLSKVFSVIFPVFFCPIFRPIKWNYLKKELVPLGEYHVIIFRTS